MIVATTQADKNNTPFLFNLSLPLNPLHDLLCTRYYI